LQYKLIGNNDTNDVINTILTNRGVSNPKQYVNLTDDCLCNWWELENINDAVDCFVKHFESEDVIAILVDCDPDGYSSAAMMYQYIKLMNKNYPVHYMIHKKPKSHGLSDNDFDIPENTKLLIVPDAGTNDWVDCNNLIANGMDIIILDHHLQDQLGNNAILVNNQISDKYSNKDFCGAGVTYEFLLALDDYFWQFYANDFLDLVAFANISDIMDLRNPATRYYVNSGLKNIKNEMLLAMIEAQAYSMHNEINIHNISWYITPIFNAMIRIGSFEERSLLFKAFIGEYEEFDYQKRDKTIVKENIYDRAARLCKNCKSRQDKMRDKLFSHLHSQANAEDKVVMVKANDADAGIVGLSCMKLADNLQRPVIVVKEVTKDGKTVLGGSCRNFNNSPVESLKDIITNTGLFDFCAGHANAAGVQIVPENFELARQAFNTMLHDVEYSPSYLCDFIFDVDELSIQFIQEVNSAKWIWCTGIQEPKIAVENIRITRKDIHVQGKSFNSVSFTNNDIKFVKFNMKENDDLLEWASAWDGKDDDAITINVVGTVDISEWQGVYTPQVVITDHEITIQN
jgi:single-stranded-DNA-specific exonuclease